MAHAAFIDYFFDHDDLCSLKQMLWLVFRHQMVVILIFWLVIGAPATCQYHGLMLNLNMPAMTPISTQHTQWMSDTSGSLNMPMPGMSTMPDMVAVVAQVAKDAAPAPTDMGIGMDVDMPMTDQPDQMAESMAMPMSASTTGHRANLQAENAQPGSVSQYGDIHNRGMSSTMLMMQGLFDMALPHLIVTPPPAMVRWLFSANPGTPPLRVIPPPEQPPRELNSVCHDILVMSSHLAA